VEQHWNLINMLANIKKRDECDDTVLCVDVRKKRGTWRDTSRGALVEDISDGFFSFFKCYVMIHLNICLVNGNRIFEASALFFFVFFVVIVVYY
jgi:hypothetical protein